MPEQSDFSSAFDTSKFPSQEQMREDISLHDAKLLRESVEEKLDLYTSLYNRFKGGEELSDDEMKIMADLSDELGALERTMGRS